MQSFLTGCGVAAFGLVLFAVVVTFVAFTLYFTEACFGRAYGWLERAGGDRFALTVSSTGLGFVGAVWCGVALWLIVAK